MMLHVLYCIMLGPPNSKIKKCEFLFQQALGQGRRKHLLICQSLLVASTEIPDLLDECWGY